MNRTGASKAVLAMALAWAATGGVAAAMDLTVKYLRAGISSIPNNADVTLVGEYMANRGLVSVEDREGGKAFSSFSVKDPDSNFTFESIYCEQGAKVFEELLNTTASATFRFYGYKGRNDKWEPVIFVRRIELVAPAETPKPAVAAAPALLRITVTDPATGRSTVLHNVTAGQTYLAGSVSLIVQKEEAAPAPAAAVGGY